MAAEAGSPARQRRLLMVTAVCALIFVADIIILNVVGDFGSWWILAVPVGLLLLPSVGLVALALVLYGRPTSLVASPFDNAAPVEFPQNAGPPTPGHPHMPLADAGRE